MLIVKILFISILTLFFARVCTRLVKNLSKKIDLFFKDKPKSKERANSIFSIDKEELEVIAIVIITLWLCNDYECVEDFIDDIRRYPEDFGYESISEKELKELEDVLQNKLDTLIQLTEDVFKMYSTPLGVYAKFSNGETWYSPCESV